MSTESTTNTPGAGAPADPASASDLLAQYLHVQRETIMDGLITVEAHDDPDSVPEMVIASRRARSALSAHRGTVHMEPEVRRLIEKLRWFGINVGAAHEMRTQSARLHAAVDVPRPRYVRGPVRGRITAYFGERTRTAWTAARDLLGSPRFSAMIESLIQIAREAENAQESTFTYRLLLQREIDRTIGCSAALPSAYWRSLRDARVMADVHAKN